MTPTSLDITPKQRLPARPLTGFDRDVGRIVAGLLDGELERRQPLTTRRWASHVLGTGDLYRHTEWPQGWGLDVIRVWLASAALSGSVADTSGPDEGDLQWRNLDGAPDTPALSAGWLHFPAGTLVDDAVVVCLDPHPTRGDTVAVLGADTARHSVELAARRLADPAHTGAAPFRGACLQVGYAGHALDLAIQPTPVDSRTDLVLPDSIWAEVDHNVHGVFARRALLERLGLGLNRGVLLYGEPGTGKTQLTRVLAHELADVATVLFVDTNAMRAGLPEVYAMASALAPSLVVLEDVDLVIQERRGAVTSAALVDFLTAIDGAMTRHSGVVTVATTNAPHAIDAAARRAARFDRIVEVPLPGTRARHLIWERYTRELSGTYNLDRLASVTAGATGADIREVVRHAVLNVDAEPDQDDLEHWAKERGFPKTGGLGHYL